MNICLISSLEHAAERRCDEMTIDDDHFKCDCGRMEKWANANTATPDPYGPPICGHCQDEIIKRIEDEEDTDMRGIDF